VAWNLTSGTARVGKATRMRRPWAPPPPRVEGDVFARASARAVAKMGPADRKALDVAFEEVGADAAVLHRALATGAHVSAVASLAGAWETLDERERALVRDPIGRTGAGAVSFLGVRAKQVDSRTCGPASLGLMLMIGDPFVALWLATGRRVGDYLPLEPLVTEVVTSDIRTIEERWRSLQHELHREANRWALGPFPWPRALGTPPWRLDNAIRFAGLRFRTRMIDDTDHDDLAAMFAHASVALADGVPVPLYVGGDSSRGLAATVPRHVVLVVGRETGGFLIFEPGSGAVVLVKDADIRAAGTRAIPGFGHWSRATCIVLPARR
jgi:hypothetical protein